jgi:hypothetical protein
VQGVCEFGMFVKRNSCSLFKGGNVRSIALIYVVLPLGYCLVVVVSLVAP